MAYNYYGQNWANTPGMPYYQQPQVQPTYQSYAPQPQQAQPVGIQWVDGEVGAKAFQMPQGWPVNTPIALWDTNDQVIYLKSVNQMGMPNPLQKLHYQMDEQQSGGYLPAAGTVSGSPDPNYVTKDDFDRKINELKDLMKNNQSSRNQNGNNGQQQNRGGNT